MSQEIDAARLAIESEQTITIDELSPYDQYVKLLYDLHDLMVEGKEDNPEVNLIRDSMDVSWKHLSVIETDQLRYLSDMLFQQDNKKILEWLLNHAIGTEWVTHHAAEDNWCPYCAKSPEDDWSHMREHHEGCEYVRMIKKAKEYLEK
jgi:ribosomal protein L30/L7E